MCQTRLKLSWEVDECKPLGCGCGICPCCPNEKMLDLHGQGALFKKPSVYTPGGANAPQMMQMQPQATVQQQPVVLMQQPVMMQQPVNQQ